MKKTLLSLILLAGLSCCMQAQAERDPLPDNPWDHKRVMVLNEFLTPALLGFDVSIFGNRHNNFGIGYGYIPYIVFGESITIQAFHPRYRWYQAKWYWSPFFEAGVDFIFLDGISRNYGTEELSHDQWSAQGGDLGFGVAMVNEGPMTLEFLLTLNAGTSKWNYPYWVWDSATGKYDTPAAFSGSSPLVVPLIGFAWGFVF